MLKRLLTAFAVGMLSFSTPLNAQTVPGTLPVVSETTIPTIAPVAEILQPAVVNGLSQGQAITPQPEPQPVQVTQVASVDPAQAICVAKAIYFESKGEPLKGQKAVGYVVLNRAKSGRFASTPCKVIAQPSQFSWYRAHKTIPTKVKSTYVALAESLINTYSRDNDPSNGALFFHATYVNPHWKNVAYLMKIGGHLFYR